LATVATLIFVPIVFSLLHRRHHVRGSAGGSDDPTNAASGV
jgi:hypothetical protein